MKFYRLRKNIRKGIIMARYKRIYETVCSGDKDTNVSFVDLLRLLELLGFKCRIKGDHFIHTKEGIKHIINIQPKKDGKAKPYQVKQIRNIINENNLEV